MLLQNMLPKNFLPRKVLSKQICFQFCSPNFYSKEFAPQIFPPKNLLPNIFALYISSHNEILLTKNSSKIYLLAKFPPHKNLSSKTSSLKFPPKKICFKKKLFSILPLPPPPPFSFKRICSPNISSQKFAAKHFCSPYHFS